MSDFGGGDWDLRAVVRGCNMSDDPHTCFSPLMYYLQEEEEEHDTMITNYRNHVEDDLIFGNVVFPEYLFADNCNNNNNSDLDLLEDLYKPFYPTNINSSENLVPEQNLEHVGIDHDHCSKPVGTKYRRRKNQHKRVVMEVTAEGMSEDMWAWRKYGQKPIKGSPYPRSYYRCSSSRGCPARKQVERSHSDPTTTTTTTNFIITYTAEHNHSKPTRRNSLAGTTRQRFSNSNTVAGAISAENNINTTTSSHEDMKKKMMKKKKKTEAADNYDKVKFINQEVIINNHDNPAAAAAAMIIISDDFLAADFEDAQLNHSLTPSPSPSSHLQFHPTQATNFW